jgi:homoserine dehydrogenase
MDSVGVGLLGLGTVGSAVAKRLLSEWQLLGERAGATPVIRRVAVRDVARTRDVDLKAIPLDADPLAVINDARVDIVVEVMGGLEPATSVIEQSLRTGRTVVTANKAVVAAAGPRLWELAAEHGAGLWFEATVGAGLPIVALLRDSLRADRITRIDAIINGTTNVILTRRRNAGVSVSEALQDAQRRGYAEADAGSDLDGWDAAYKLVIMAWLAFDTHVDVNSVDRRGITDLDVVDLGYAGQLGYTVKLLATALISADGQRIHLQVRPTAIPAGHALFDVDDAENAVIITSDLASSLTLRGLGAGGDSTASAVVGDIVNAVQHRGHEPRPATLRTRDMMSAEDVEVAGYVRLLVADDPDARGLAVQALEDRGVPVVEAIDKPPLDGPHPQLLLLTGTAPRAVHDRALETLDTLADVREIACALDRIEPES